MWTGVGFIQPLVKAFISVIYKFTSTFCLKIALTFYRKCTGYFQLGLKNFVLIAMSKGIAGTEKAPAEFLVITLFTRCGNKELIWILRVRRGFQTLHYDMFYELLILTDNLRTKIELKKYWFAMCLVVMARSQVNAESGLAS